MSDPINYKHDARMVLSQFTPRAKRLGARWPSTAFADVHAS